MRRNGSGKHLIFALAGVLATGAAVGGFMLTDAQQHRPTTHGSENNLGQDSSSADSHDPDPDPLQLASIKSADERIAHVQRVASEPGAVWNNSTLRQAIMGDPAESVQIAALEESIRLARKEGGDAPSNAVRLGLASNKGNTRAAALKAAKENADPAMVDELIALVDQRDPYAPMALNALAYTNDPKARNKILELVEDESTDRKLRERAIALIGITKDREAIATLVDLRNGPDHELARLAEEVLKVLNQ